MSVINLSLMSASARPRRAGTAAQSPATGAAAVPCSGAALMDIRADSVLACATKAAMG
jgi:hypothetical protein